MTYDEIKGTVGSMLFLWASIEVALSEALMHLNDDDLPKSAYRISGRIELWLAAMERRAAGNVRLVAICQTVVEHLNTSLQLRNMICHGFRGATSSDAFTVGEEAHLRVQLGEPERKIYWSELQGMFRWMSRAPRTIGNLTSCATGLSPAKIEEMIYVWELFPAIR